MRILVGCSPGTLGGKVRQKKKSPLPSNGIAIPIYLSLFILSYTLAIFFIKLLYRLFASRLTSKIKFFLKPFASSHFFLKTILVILILAIYIFLGLLLLLLNFFLLNVTRPFLIVRKTRPKHELAKILLPAIYNVRMI